ncbi:MAG: acyl-CoA dehydrogenase family protein, partial [Alphaproteobacteria bacterium]
EGQGWEIAAYLLGHERGSMSLVVLIEEMFDSLRTIGARERSGDVAVADTRAFGRGLAAAEIDYMALRQTAERIMRAVTADRPVGHAASVLKLGRNRLTQDVARLMLEAGGYAALPSDPDGIRGAGPPPDAPHLFRMAPEYFDSRKSSIAGGTEEIQKDLVARRMLGL